MSVYNDAAEAYTSKNGLAIFLVISVRFMNGLNNTAIDLCLQIKFQHYYHHHHFTRSDEISLKANTFELELT